MGCSGSKEATTGAVAAGSGHVTPQQSTSSVGTPATTKPAPQDRGTTNAPNNNNVRQESAGEHPETTKKRQEVAVSQSGTSTGKVPPKENVAKATSQLNEDEEASCKTFGLEPSPSDLSSGNLLTSQRSVIHESSSDGLQIIDGTPETLKKQMQSDEDNLAPLPHSSSSPALALIGKKSSNQEVAAQIASGLDPNGNPKLMKHSSSVIGLDAMIEERREAGGLTTNVVRIEVPFGKPIEEVYNGVHDGKILGSGISGVVRLVTHKATGVKYAVKCLDLGLIETEEGLHQLREEIFIMCQLDHPNIVRLEEVYESHNEIYLVQELCLGGELFDRLDDQPDYHYTEQQCARLVKQMLSAVRYIHSKGIIHRDLKLENFLFSSTSPESELRMIDFGLSKHFEHGQVHQEAVGTPYTVAPEVIRGSYGEKCDIWAIGVITYLLLSGDPPFGGCGGPEPLTTVRMNILKGQFRFQPKEIWCNVSQAAKDFICQLLVTDPAERPNAEEAQKATWMVEWANNHSATLGEEGNLLSANVVNALVGFKEYSDMRKLLCEVLSFTLLPSQIHDLKKEFEKIDTEGRGEITFEALKTVLMRNAESGALGSLTEEEVADIFNAMRVRKTDQTIHWHEFIAAGLSQCDVDDRNLRLAFDRLDAHHKGYVTFDDVLDLMGASGGESEEAIKAMFQDSLQLCRSKHARITYEDFLLLMKGQTHEDAARSQANQPPVMHSPIVSYRRSNRGLGASGGSGVVVGGLAGLAPPCLDLGTPASAGGGTLEGLPPMPIMPSLIGTAGTNSLSSTSPKMSDNNPSGISLAASQSLAASSAAAGSGKTTLLPVAGVTVGRVGSGPNIAAVAPDLPSVKEDPTKEHEEALEAKIDAAMATASSLKTPSMVRPTVNGKQTPTSASSFGTSSTRTPLVPSFDGSDFDAEDEAPPCFDDEDVGATAPLPQLPYTTGAAKGEEDGMTTPRAATPVDAAPGQAGGMTKFTASALSKTAFPQPIGRNRSKSHDSGDSMRSPIESPITPRPTLDGQHSKSCHARPIHSPTDSRRSILLPEHMKHSPNLSQSDRSLLKGVVGENGVTTTTDGRAASSFVFKKTPLVVNRELYRAHRMMRLAVLEASKRFEEKQIMRECLNIQEAMGDEKGTESGDGSSTPTRQGDKTGASDATLTPTDLSRARSEITPEVKPRPSMLNVPAHIPKKAEEGVAAGLVMRHGTKEKQNSTGAEAMRLLLKEREKERQAQLAAATKKSGRRGRGNRRNKTVSDMSAMMAGMENYTDTGSSNPMSNCFSPRRTALPTLHQSASNDSGESQDGISPSASGDHPPTSDVGPASMQMFRSTRNFDTSIGNMDSHPGLSTSASLSPSILSQSTKHTSMEDPSTPSSNGHFRASSIGYSQPVETIDENHSLRNMSPLPSSPCNLRRHNTVSSSTRSRDELMDDEEESN